jgi:hypothetical protein
MKIKWEEEEFGVMYEAEIATTKCVYAHMTVEFVEKTKLWHGHASLWTEDKHDDVFCVGQAREKVQKQLTKKVRTRLANQALKLIELVNNIDE